MLEHRHGPFPWVCPDGACGNSHLFIDSLHHFDGKPGNTGFCFDLVWGPNVTNQFDRFLCLCAGCQEQGYHDCQTEKNDWLFFLCSHSFDLPYF